MNAFARILTFVFLGYIILSCNSPKKMILFQHSVAVGDTVNLPTPYEQVIGVGDILSIQVSSLSTQAADLFNAYATPATDNYQQITSTSLNGGKGYRVDGDGRITMAVIGVLDVVGLTDSEAELLIGEKLKPQLKEFRVTVRNLNFRVSVLGEVGRPGLFTINSGRVTLPEALGLAGDITIYGRRTNVLLIREMNEKKYFVNIDLTRRDLFRSPYFYLHPNDILYVEPGKVRLASADRIYLISPLVVGILTTAAIIFTRL